MIEKANAALLEQRQAVVVRVNHQDWLVLGRSLKALVKYVELVPFYLKRKFSGNSIMFLTGGFIGFFAIKKGN